MIFRLYQVATASVIDGGGDFTIEDVSHGVSHPAVLLKDFYQCNEAQTHKREYNEGR